MLCACGFRVCEEVAYCVSCGSRVERSRSLALRRRVMPATTFRLLRRPAGRLPVTIAKRIPLRNAKASAIVPSSLAAPRATAPARATCVAECTQVLMAFKYHGMRDDEVLRILPHAVAHCDAPTTAALRLSLPTQQPTERVCPHSPQGVSPRQQTRAAALRTLRSMWTAHECRESVVNTTLPRFRLSARPPDALHSRRSCLRDGPRKLSRSCSRGARDAGNRHGSPRG